MEAVAKFQFKATADDELSFEKGSIVKVSFKVLYNGFFFQQQFYTTLAFMFKHSSQIDV